MQQVKIFKSVESELGELQNEINIWIKKNKVKVISITGNIAAQAPSTSGIQSGFSSADVLVIVLYVRG